MSFINFWFYSGRLIFFSKFHFFFLLKINLHRSKLLIILLNINLHYFDLDSMFTNLPNPPIKSNL